MTFGSYCMFQNKIFKQIQTQTRAESETLGPLHDDNLKSKPHG
jgi:hypothetical protein